MEYKPILEHAQTIAERASDIALSFFRQAILIEMKENMTPVTIADKKTEEMMRQELSLAFPDLESVEKNLAKNGRITIWYGLSIP